jgi:Fe-S-cluster-containing hydrogenase component 2
VTCLQCEMCMVSCTNSSIDAALTETVEMLVTQQKIELTVALKLRK